MDRKKIIYIGSILLVTIFVSVTYFSYAFFTSKEEYHGRVNMVVGTLDYKIKSTDLDNNQITIPANTEKKLEIEIKSLNDIDSKYELYYTTTSNDIDIGYSTLKDNATGTIPAKGKKYIVLKVTNSGSSNANITFGVEGGFTYNNLVLSNDKTSIEELNPITVTYDKGNLLYGLEDVGETTDNNLTYSISNGKLFLKGSGDGWGHTPGRVYLESGKTYIFNMETNREYSFATGTNGVGIEAWLKLDGGWNDKAHLSTNTNCEFTVQTTGVYWLRLDVNTSGNVETAEVWNISIKEKNPETKQVVYGEEYGSLPTIPERNGYVFKGWNGKNLLDYNKITPIAIKYGIGVDSNGNVSDNTPTTDGRVWGDIDKSNWKVFLNSGTYTFSMFFSVMTTNNTSSQYEITPNIYNKWGLSNLEKETYSFTLSESKYIGMLIKAYDGIYKTQIEEGNISTPWEPYYITSSTKVTQTQNHTLTAIWDRSGLYDINNNQVLSWDELVNLGFDITSDFTEETSNNASILSNYSNGVKLVLPSDGRINKIGNYALYKSLTLQSIIIPDSVTSIGNSAFDGARNLSFVSMGNGVTTIGNRAFCDNDSLANIKLSDKTQSIGEYAFAATGLESITLPDTVTSIGNSAFYHSQSLKTAVLSNGLTTLSPYAFTDCLNLETVDFKNGITVLGDHAFYNANKLTTVTLSNNLTEIGEFAFVNCDSLTQLNFPNTLKKIGNNAFSYTKLASITLPSSLELIGAGAFWNCSTLSSVTFNNPNGWFAATAATDQSGTDLILNNTSTNATYLKNTYNNKYWIKSLLVTRAVLDEGTFVNVTPEYLTNQVNGTDGFTIVGAATTHWTDPNYSTYLRWDYEIDLTNYSLIKFYGKKNANHGNIAIMITDGLNDYSNTNVYFMENTNYRVLALDEWIEYTVDVSEITGNKTVSFIGGYTDFSGYPESSTSFSNIRFIH